MNTSSLPSAISPDELTPDELEFLLANPSLTAAALDMGDADDKLTNYAKYIWPVIEPVQPFILCWAIEAMAEHLEAVTYGYIDKLLINIPPGFGKSVWTDQLWPSWEWGPKNRPWTKYVSASYGQHLTVRNNDRFRTIVNSPEYKLAWGSRFELVKDNSIKVENNKTGFKFATSVDGIGTGERGHRVVVDDPHNVKQAESDVVRTDAVMWFTETMPTRLIPVPPGWEGKIPRATVIIMQRVHEADISGEIISHASALGYEHLCIEMEFDPSHPYARKRRSRIGFRDPRADRYEASLAAWEVLKARRDVALGTVAVAEEGLLSPHGGLYAESIAMLETVEVPPEVPAPLGGELAWPELHGPKAVEDLKETLSLKGGDYAIAGQLQQQPVARKGGMFARDKLVTRPAYLCPRPRNLVRGWDLAGSKTSRSPYTAGCLLSIQNGTVYVWDMIRQRYDAGELENFLVREAKRDGYAVTQDFPQDPGQSGKVQVISIVKALLGYSAFFSPETGSKDDRAKPLAAQVEAGNLVLVEGHWNAECIKEMGMFPGSKWKDQVDAMSRAFARAISAHQSGPPVGGYTVQPDFSTNPYDSFGDL